MKNFIAYTLGIVLLAGLFLACSDSDPEADNADTERPVVRIVTSSPLATESVICNAKEDFVIQAITGETISIDLEFEDNRNLSQYKIDVHNNFDCHSHGRVAASSWQVLTTKDISGSSYTVTENLEVPEDALAGDYHLQIQCLDELGNEAEPIFYSIQLTSSKDRVPPVVAIELPVSLEITAAKGDALFFTGTVNDNYSLDNGRVEISYTAEDGTSFFPVQRAFGADAGTSTPFETGFNIPASAVAGTYTLTVTAFDTFNNFTEKVFKLTITE